MRLDLPIPATWPRVSHPVFGEIAFVPGSSGPPDLAITRSALNVLPDEQPEWIQQTLHADTSANTSVTITSNDVRTTRAGWPVRIVSATLHRGESVAASEWRTIAFYAFFEHGATAVIRSTNEGRYREHREALLELLLAGTPDWSGEVPTQRQPVCEQLVRSAISPTRRLEELAERRCRNRASGRVLMQLQRLLGIGILGVTLAACDHSSSAEPSKKAPATPAKKEPMGNDVKLDVALSKSGSKLHIDYTVTNNTAAKIMLWDQVVGTSGDKLIAMPNAISTKNSGQLDTVLFVRGRVSPDSRVNFEYVPGVRPLDAGKSAKGSAEVELPLRAWLAYGQVQPLAGTPTKAIFELQYFAGETPTQPTPLDVGGTLAKPTQWGSAVAVRFGPVALP
jgi:hypothetical protein